MIVVASLIALTTFLPMMTPGSYQVWLVSRLITGGTLGGVFGCAMPLVTELFPQKYRGKLAAVLTSLFSLAMIFGVSSTRLWGFQLAGADVYSHHTSGGGGSHDFPVCTQRLPEYQAVK